MTEVVALETRAEQLKLARTLGVEPEDLEFLAGAQPADLRVLRERIDDDLFERDAHHFGVIVSVARRLPTGLAAQLAQRALGATLAARTAPLLEPELAADFVRRLPAPFLADIAAEADVARLGHVLAALPAGKLADAAAELAAREEWIPMGAFFSQVDDAQLDAALEVLDSEALLRTGFVIEDKRRLVEIIDRIDDDRLLDYLRTAVELDLLPEALDLAGHLSPAGLKRMAGLLEELTDDELAAMGDKVRGERVLREAAAPLLEHASPRVRSFSAPTGRSPRGRSGRSPSPRRA